MNPIAAELDKLQKVCRNSKDITGETLELYAEELADLPVDQVVQSIRELRKSSVFFPALSEIRNRVVAIIAGPILVDPEASWSEVQRNIREYGAAGMVRHFHDGEMHEYRMTWSSPMIERAIGQFDWKELCLTNIEQNPTYMTTMRAQFRDALKAIQRREVDLIVSGRATDGAALTKLATGEQATDTTPAIGETVRALPDRRAS